MALREGRHIIEALRVRWRRWMLTVLVLHALAIVAPLFAIVLLLTSVSLYWPLLVFPVVLLFLWFFDKRANISSYEVARYLAKTEPTLEESATLLLEEPKGLLQTLQSEKTSAQLNAIVLPQPWRGPLRNAGIVLLLSVLVSSGVTWLLVDSETERGNKQTKTEIERTPAGVAAVSVNITPPAYTGKRKRDQREFGMTVEENSTVHWQVKTSSPANQLSFVFNDSLKIALQPDAAKTSWTLTQQIRHTGFYQVIIDSLASELYRIEMIADEAPSITIQRPAPHTTIEPGMPQNSLLQATVSDDYGVQDVTIMATIASGSGEGVKFREEQLRFPVSFSSQAKQYALQRTLDLSALKMSPGDELYFYLLAKDNAGNEKRSDIAIIIIADTAELMSLSGLQMGVNIKPDYFRSQRQIILDTEKLLREKDTMSVERFKERSNNLGIDQKLLRLRYGKFLGEENNMGGEDGEGHGDGHDDHDDEGAADFGNAEKILDAVSHKHDISEDATFFSAETKAALKATLAEMWSAELHLRTYEPAKALPFEYKALRLLKELQQKDRVYVAKTSLKTTPLKPEKRLTADLSKVMASVVQHTLTISKEEMQLLKNAIAELEHTRATLTVPASAAMNAAYRHISNAAAQAPVAYLDALSSMKRLQEASVKKEKASIKDIDAAEKALQRLVNDDQPLPYKPGNNRSKLGEQYFQQLQQRRTP